MKKADIRELREVTLQGDYRVPDGWVLVKEPVKVIENGVECIKVVIGKP